MHEEIVSSDLEFREPEVIKAKDWVELNNDLIADKITRFFKTFSPKSKNYKDAAEEYKNAFTLVLDYPKKLLSFDLKSRNGSFSFKGSLESPRDGETIDFSYNWE